MVKKTHSPVEVSQILDLPFSKAKWKFIAAHIGSLWLCYFHHTLQGFLCSVPIIIHQTSLSFRAGPCFYLPLLSCIFSISLLCGLTKPFSSKGESFLFQRRMKGRETECVLAVAGLSLQVWVMRLWTIHINHSCPCLTKSEGCSKLKEASEATDL